MKSLYYGKEGIKKQVEEIGKHIIVNAERIVNDMDFTHLRTIIIEGKITAGEIPTIEVKKEYIPENIFKVDEKEENVNE